MTTRYPPRVQRSVDIGRGSGLQIRVDKCKRVSQCRLCESPIVKYANRFTLQVTIIPGVQPSSGKGKFYRREFFFHPECFSNWLLPEDRTFSGAELCFECGLPMTACFNRVYAGKYRGNKYLCGACVKLPAWRYCHVCNMYAHRYDTSPLIENEMQTGHFACDHCVEEFEGRLITVKTRKRERRKANEGTDSGSPSPPSEPVVPF